MQTNARGHPGAILAGRRPPHLGADPGIDYLLGDWEFTAVNQEYGQLRGYWSAVRLDEGQILDEYRIVGDCVETYYVTTTRRNYNGALEQWELVGADAGTGLRDVGTRRTVTVAGPQSDPEREPWPR